MRPTRNLQTTLNEANETLSAVLADPAKVLQSGALPKINATTVEAPKRAQLSKKPAPVSDPAEDLKARRGQPGRRRGRGRRSRPSPKLPSAAASTGG